MGAKILDNNLIEKNLENACCNIVNGPDKFEGDTLEVTICVQLGTCGIWPVKENCKIIINNISWTKTFLGNTSDYFNGYFRNIKVTGRYNLTTQTGWVERKT